MKKTITTSVDKTDDTAKQSLSLRSNTLNKIHEQQHLRRRTRSNFKLFQLKFKSLLLQL